MLFKTDEKTSHMCHGGAFNNVYSAGAAGKQKRILLENKRNVIQKWLNASHRCHGGAFNNVYSAGAAGTNIEKTRV